MVTDYRAHHDWTGASKAARVKEIDHCLCLGAAQLIFFFFSMLPLAVDALTYKDSRHATGNVRHDNVKQ